MEQIVSDGSIFSWTVSMVFDTHFRLRCGYNAIASSDSSRHGVGPKGDESIPTFHHHPKWTPMVKSVGWELVTSSSQAVDENSNYYSWDLGIIDHGTMVNAFALPGGVVRVTLALLEQLDLTEGELAALLGHEMGHVLCRHSQARVLQRQVVSMIFQALTYQDNDAYQESFGEAVGELLLKSADWVGQQAFSRKDE
jgi:Zn-dependent protease with chaperone function